MGGFTMSNLVLGLDIGISSVGWGIINETTGEIVSAGVRLFEEANRNANEDRRNFRSARRLKRRRKHRLERTRALLEENHISCEGIQRYNPYEARCHTLYEKVNKDELAAALYHLVKRRGTTLDTPQEDEKTSGNELSTKEQLKKNAKKLEDRYICEIQLDKIKKGQVVRDHTNRFKTADYIKEATAILEKQQEFHSEITDSFKTSYLALIDSRRMYYDGPGSEKSPTPYGQYFIGEDGKLKHETMINKMRGRCTYFPEELRIAKMSYTADLYNLLNDLNNLWYANDKKEKVSLLSIEDKTYLIETFIKNGKKITLNGIAKYLAIPEEELKGARIDLKTNKPIFTDFVGLKKLLKLLKPVSSVPADFFDNSAVLDEVAEILTAEKSLIRREEQLTDLFQSNYQDDLPEVTAALINDTTFKEYHALSKKAMQLILPELWETNKNQMQIFSERGLGKSRLEQLQNGTKIQFDDEAILSTVAKRAHREAIKITNAVREQYGELAYVVVEMAREKNSDEERLNYSNFQRNQGKFEKKICDLLEVKNLKDLYLNGKQHLALKLWDAQDGKCIYSGKSIALSDIVHDFNRFEVDHIIPLSYSFDDSQQNKVLVYHAENQLKGQLTPFQYFQSGKATRSFDEFKADCLNLFKSRRISNKKLGYLLEQRDVQHDEEIQKDFINRNLVDTQYAMRSFSSSLRTFYQNNAIPTKVLSIRGSFTAALRRRTKLRKDRDAGHAHHAIDALIVAGVGRMPLFEQLKQTTFNIEGVAVDTETGEIIDPTQVFDNHSLKFVSQLRNYEDKIKYSHKVDRKPNRTMSNQTIYSTREKDDEKYIVGKVKNIYQLDKKGYQALKKRIEKDPDLFLMAQHDEKTWKLIRKIMEEHSHADNPFQDFYKEHGFILKDGKVPVKSLKYLDKKLGIHVNISDKYKDAQNDVVLLSRKSIRADIYQNEEGKYKYLGVPYNWFTKVDGIYTLDMDLYNGENGRNASYKNIDNSYEFQFSLYKNDMISYNKLETIEDEITKEKIKKIVHYEKLFRGDAMPRVNNIEIENTTNKTIKQQFVTVTTLRNLKKFNTNILGIKYLIEKESFSSYSKG